jgi:hypothetical protein
MPYTCLEVLPGQNAFPPSDPSTQKLLHFPITELLGELIFRGLAICPEFAPRSVKLLKHDTLKSYPGLPHGMPTTHADQINADLLAFVQQRNRNSAA